METPPLHVELKTLRLGEPFRIAHGTSAERTVLRLHRGDAVGEAPFVPYYKERPEDTLGWLEGLAWNGGAVPTEGPRAGRLALDLLWHDIIGKQRNQTLGEIWKLDSTHTPPGGRSLGIPDDLDAFAEKVRETSRQFRVLKLKLGSGDLDFDEAIAARACETAPQAMIFADANGGWSATGAAQVIPRLARLGLKFIEQPVHHQHGLEGWKELRGALPSCPLPLYADESVQQADDVIRLQDLVDGVNVKLLKSGSFSEARTTIRFARDLGMKVMLGCMIESSIGVTAAAHLAPLADWIDLDGHLYVANDDYEGIAYDGNGHILMPARPDWESRPSAERMKTESKTEVQGWLQSLLPEALDWLRRMVAINSFTANAQGVNWLGALTTECFESLGFKPEYVPSEVAGYGRHLFLTRQGTGGKPVLLVTHLDTVFPPEEEMQNHFQWDEDSTKGRIYGPGTVDIKGGTVMIWMILQAIRKFAPRAFEETQWIVAANASEEVMAKDFADRAAERCPRGAAAVLVFEGGPRKGTEYQVVTSRKGRAEYRIHAQGIAAHAGSDHKTGVNAIVSLCDAVQSVSRLTDYQRQLTLNVGRIQGGTVLNRVPHEASADLEMRAFDPAVLREAGAALESLAATSADAGRAKITVECLGRSPAWPAEDGALRWFAHWQRAAGEIGLSVVSVARGGLSDANYLCHLGPTLDGLGPSGANAHCSERSADGSKVPEFVETASFVPKAAMNVLAISRLPGVAEKIA